MNTSSPTSMACSSSFSITRPRYLTWRSVMMAAATIPVKSSVLSAPSYKTCTSKSGSKPSREQANNQENKQITITNLVGVHPAHRAVLQGQVTSISALLGAKPRGHNPNITALLGGGQNESARIGCK